MSLVSGLTTMGLEPQDEGRTVTHAQIKVSTKITQKVSSAPQAPIHSKAVVKVSAKAVIKTQTAPPEPEVKQTPKPEVQVTPWVQVVDNDGGKARSRRDTQGYRQEGRWYVSHLRGYNGSEVRMSYTKKAKAVYTVRPGEGRTCVAIYSMRTPSGLDRAQITLKQGRDVLYRSTVSQEGPEGGDWFDLGGFDLDPQRKVSLYLERDPFGSNGMALLADAVKFEKCPVAGSNSAMVVEFGL